MDLKHKIYPHIKEITGQFEGILLDAYGVFWGGNGYGLLEGAKETMAKLVKEGKIVGVLSNATQLSIKEIEKVKMNGLNLNEHFHFFITSGDIVKHTLLNKELPFKKNHDLYYLFCGKHPKYSSHLNLFEGTTYQETNDIEAADFIFIGVPHIAGIDQESAEVFIEQIERLVEKKVPMICPNPDLYAHEGNPPKQVVRQGMIAKIYQEMGGQVFYMGKPNKKMFEHAMKAFNQFHITDKQKILMVGDTIETDIRGANNYGMKSALTVLSGIMKDRADKEGMTNILDNLSACDVPTYLIERFIHDF